MFKGANRKCQDWCLEEQKIMWLVNVTFNSMATTMLQNCCISDLKKPKLSSLVGCSSAALAHREHCYFFPFLEGAALLLTALLRSL